MNGAGYAPPPDSQVQWLQSRIGHRVWLGISCPNDPSLHGQRWWNVCNVVQIQSGVWNVLLQDPAQRRPARWVAIPSIFYGGDGEPPMDAWFRSQWDQGLSDPPSFEELIVEATKAQETK